MDFIVPRPASQAFGTALCAEFFQIAYVTNDIERACEVFASNYSIASFTPLEQDTPGGGLLKMRLAWAGGVMIELIEARGAGAELYNGVLPAEGFAIRHHHVGYLVADDREWQALQNTLEEKGMPIEFGSNLDGVLRFIYVRSPELGHYLEYVQLYEAGKGIMQGVAAN